MLSCNPGAGADDGGGESEGDGFAQEEAEGGPSCRLQPPDRRL